MVPKTQVVSVNESKLHISTYFTVAFTKFSKMSNTFAHYPLKGALHMFPQCFFPYGCFMPERCIIGPFNVFGLFLGTYFINKISQFAKKKVAMDFDNTFTCASWYHQNIKLEVKYKMET